MDSIQGLVYGFSVALTPDNLFAALIGAFFGTFVGVLPGLGPMGAMALLMSFTLTLKPVTGMIMLAGIYYGAMYGGSTTSILMNVPGETTSVVTCIDGYQMARKGRAGAALTVSAIGSFVAGTVGIVGLMVFAPTLADVAIAFGAPDYFAVCLLGLFACSRISGGSIWKAFISIGAGMAISTVGMQQVSGTLRFTFGNTGLMQGIDIVPVAMGLFGVSEVLSVAEEAGGLPQILSVKMRELFPTGEEWRRSFAPILRATGLGFFIGLIPGPAAVISTFASYNLEKRLSKHPEEFGRGAIEGVAGPESANNAATAGAMVPLMALGVPFAPVTAMLMAALLIQGVHPGPLLITEHPDIFWGLIASMYVGNVALILLNLPLIGMWVSMLRIPQPALLGLILVFIMIGTFSVNSSTFDLLIVSVVGVIGWLLRKLKFDLAPIILAVVLGPFMERTFQQSMAMNGGDMLIFVQRPISLTLLIFLAAVMVLPWLLSSIRARKMTVITSSDPS
jgi:putative tricarboxylic transport membrane protein